MLSTLNDCLAMANTVKVAKKLQNSRWPHLHERHLATRRQKYCKGISQMGLSSSARRIESTSSPSPKPNPNSSTGPSSRHWRDKFSLITDLELPTGKFHRDVVTTQRAVENPLLMVYKVLVAPRSRTRCHAPGCPHSLASTRTEWKRCSACRVAAYCGKPCQTRAWKSGPYAHKTICPQIKALVAKGGGLDDQDVFNRNCRASDVSVDEVLRVAKWEFNPTRWRLRRNRGCYCCWAKSDKY
ncbi:hypothetical protein C8F04DRAFT_1258790 [Mycena alexandri]|uniref:MYND-type domain-containing protein n=1 Tax=Mycena alexandri TaxID=1745969 RepID=A0AAD6SY35_9AGAR|nr:hypothetical protein C8F04DRAFT_1258790 [Mycena alexandri]